MDLKPCPFCGNKELAVWDVDVDGTQGEDTMTCTSLNPCPGGDYCRKCSHAIYHGAVTVNGKEWRFEFNPQFGPTFIGKRGEPLAKQPGGRNKVWEHFAKIAKW